MKTRLKRTLGVILVLLTALLVYGVGIEPRLILAVDREPATLPHLPPSWDGQRLAVISDFHVGMWLDNSAMVQRAVQQIVAWHPAAVFLLGDFINQVSGNVSGEIHTVTGIVRPLAVARIPTYAVLGNHDYGVTGSSTLSQPQVAARLRQALTDLGVRVLQNSAVALSSPGRPVPSTRSARSPLYVVGLGPHEANDDRPPVALRGVPPDAPRIVLMHDPDSFLQLPPGSAPLGIAGHTHCGQVGIPFVTHWVLSLAEGHAAPEDGWNAHYGQPGNRLYVTCGLGLGVVPLRIDDPPQITVFTLHRA